MPKRILKGIVTSDKNDKTVTVTVNRRVKHPIYKKIITKSKKYHAHDEYNRFKEGDEISIVESRPLSKTKNWAVIYTDAQNQEPIAPKAEKKQASIKKAVKKDKK